MIGLHADLNPLAGRRYFDDPPPVARYLDDAPRPLVAGTPGLPHRVFVEPAPLLRANQMFRAVALPPGRHQVVFRYRPPALLIGAAISLASALLAALAAAIGRKRSAAAV